MKFRAWLGLGLLALGLVVTAGCGGGGSSSGGSAKGELVIGVYGSLTGGDATFGQSTKMGVDLAMAELQASAGGKVGGIPVRTVTEDDQGKAEEAATVVQKLINQDGVIGVLGEVASSRSLAAAPLCQQAGVPMISPSSTNPKVTQVGDFIFRMCFLDDFQGQSMAKFAAQNLGLKRVAILKDVKSDYSVGLAQYFTEAFTGMGGQIVAEQAYTAGDPDFSGQITAIKARSPEAIFIPGYYTEVGLIARKARELGLTVPLLGGDGWESEKLIDIGGESMNGAYYSNHWALDKPDAKLQEFLGSFRKANDSDPDAIAGLAYDAAKVLLHCLDQLSKSDPASFQALATTKVGSPERRAAQQKLRDLIAGTKDYVGVTGTITLDENRNASKPLVVIEIKGGKKVYNTTMNP